MKMIKISSLSINGKAVYNGSRIEWAISNVLKSRPFNTSQIQQLKRSRPLRSMKL